MSSHLNTKVSLYLKQVSTKEIHYKLCDVFHQIIKDNESFFKNGVKPLYMYFNTKDYELIKNEDSLHVFCSYGRFPFVYKVDTTLPQGEQYIKLH